MFPVFGSLTHSKHLQLSLNCLLLLILHMPGQCLLCCSSDSYETYRMRLLCRSLACTETRVIEAHRCRDQTAKPGLDVPVTRPGESTPLRVQHYARHKLEGKKTDLFTCGAKKSSSPPIFRSRYPSSSSTQHWAITFSSDSMYEGRKIKWTNGWPNHRGLAVSIPMVISSLSVRPLNLEADKISSWPIPPYWRNSHSDCTNSARTPLASPEG